MIINILIIVLCIAADQLTKICAAANLKEISTLPIIENIFHFTYVENRGAAFGMLADHRWVFMILSVVGIAAIFLSYGNKAEIVVDETCAVLHRRQEASVT